jgi:hypothetical protein
MGPMMLRSKLPIYIPSKGRHANRMTIDYLEAFGQYPVVVVEASEYSDYRAAVHPKTEVLVLPREAQLAYDTCDELGDSMTFGSGPARNFAWDHAQEMGHDWFWLMDDNIRGLAKTPSRQYLRDATGFVLIEDAVWQFSNVALAGPEYWMFIPGYNPGLKSKSSESWNRFGVVNTRIMSCTMIRTDLPFRFRGRYNEDVILGLDVMKAGWNTICFYGVVQNKMKTQTGKGGNTDRLYRGPGGGTWAKSKMLYDVHPDVTKLKWRYGRCHHFVDYTRFRRLNRLKPNPEAPERRVKGISMRAGA